MSGPQVAKRTNLLIDGKKRMSSRLLPPSGTAAVRLHTPSQITPIEKQTLTVLYKILGMVSGPQVAKGSNLLVEKLVAKVLIL